MPHFSIIIRLVISILSSMKEGALWAVAANLVDMLWKKVVRKKND